MDYTVTITLRDNSKGGADRSWQRTVRFNRERSSVHPHEPLPVDVEQKQRVLRMAIDEAAIDAVKNYPVAGRD